MKTRFVATVRVTKTFLRKMTLTCGLAEVSEIAKHEAATTFHDAKWTPEKTTYEFVEAEGYAIAEDSQ